MAVRKGSYPVLRMPLDLSVPVDLEVYNILYDFKSAVACKNFLLSAVLYYARSPLVVSANALTEALDKAQVQRQIDRVMGKMEEILNAVSSLSLTVVSQVPEKIVEGIPPVLNDGLETGGVGEGLDGRAKSVLLSLKQQFRV